MWQSRRVHVTQKKALTDGAAEADSEDLDEMNVELFPRNSKDVDAMYPQTRLLAYYLLRRPSNGSYVAV